MPDANTYLWFFFKFRGRVGRATYFLANLLIGVIQFYPIYKGARALVPLGPENLMNRNLEELLQLSPDFERWYSVIAFVAFLMLWPGVALAVKRLHDMNRSGLFAIALFLPFIQVVAFLVLCLAPGTRGPNQHGVRPDVPQ